MKGTSRLNLLPFIFNLGTCFLLNISSIYKENVIFSVEKQQQTESTSYKSSIFPDDGIHAFPFFGTSSGANICTAFAGLSYKTLVCYCCGPHLDPGYNAPVICIPGSLGAGDSWDTAELKCRDLTFDESRQCRRGAAVLISRQNTNLCHILTTRGKLSPYICTV